VALGDAITSYLLRAYERLKERGAAPNGPSGLSQRDQTMLSRRISASFARRVGKIMRLPCIRPERDLFDSLEISFEELHPREKDMAFTAQGITTGADRKSRQKETVRQDASVVRLAAWLVANELYRPGQYLQAGSLPSPVTLPDVTGLLDAVHAMFPTEATFAPPLSWGLALERVTAALVVVNFLSPREEKQTVSADVLYATSWGELFHLERTDGLELLSHSPSVFLSDQLGLQLDPSLRLSIHAPARSQCQLARISRRD
jgi:adenylate cyclase, class 1